AGINGALPVAHGDILIPSREEQLHDGHRRRSCTGSDDPHILLLLAHHLQGVGKACQSDDSSTVLVVMENGNVAALLQLALDLKAPGSGNILQIDTAEATGDLVHRLYKCIHILAL